MQTYALLEEYLISDIVNITLNYLEPDKDDWHTTYTTIGFGEKAMEDVKRGKSMVSLMYSANKGLVDACSMGYVELAQTMINAGAQNYSHAFAMACRYGQESTIHFMLRIGFREYDFSLDLECALAQACEGSHLSVVKHLIAVGASCRNAGPLRAASQRGHLDVVKFIINACSKDINGSLYNSCKSGHKHISEYLINVGGATRCEYCMGANHTFK